MMRKELEMSPVYETTTVNFRSTRYHGVNQTDALLSAQQSGFECAVTKDGRLFASYSPISGMKFYN